jgi:hypothetical protein
LVTSFEVREEIEPGFGSIVQGCTGVAETMDGRERPTLASIFLPGETLSG